MKSIQQQLFILVLFVLALSSCMNDKYNEVNETLNYSNFDFKTTRDFSMSVTTLTDNNQALSGVYLEFYSQNPLTESGTLISNASDYLVYKGITLADGKLNCTLTTATYVDSVHVLVNYIGLPSMVSAKLSNGLAIRIGGSSAQNGPQKVQAVSAVLPAPTKISGYYVLGNWSAAGAPNYLVTSDVISAAFKADVNASLPERVKLPVSHPEYLTTQDDGSLELIEDAEVWVTFVHEGTGFKNVFGYYTHPNDNAPATAQAITDPTVIFPNASYDISGGTLKSGNKVQLLYLNPTTNQYSTVFPAGTTVAWFIVTAGFVNDVTISAGRGKYYSDVRFNPEPTVENRKHNVLLKDDARKLLLIGFEDLYRDSKSDDDFNDVVFYTTVSPYTAVKVDDVKPIDTNVDTDGDGVGDTRDEYPNDKDRAFNNYYPAKNQIGTLAFEDMWPHKGDYDFNDLVVDYNFNHVANAQNSIVEINAALTVRAIGASFRNAFAIELNTTPDNVKSISGQQLTKSIFTLNSNLTEASQAKAVVPIFDDSFGVLKYAGSIVNTVNGGAYAAPQTLNVKVVFNTPIALSSFGTPPYNPFMVVNADRSKEIHLPGGAPTSLANTSLFGTGDDNTDLATKKYYMSDKYLPWAINLPTQFAYPAEKQDITKTHLMFNAWANSRGYNYMDWYMLKTGYRDESKIFIKR